MNWNKIKNMQNFYGAEAVYESSPWLLAKWNHSQCRGWQLYCRPSSQSQRTRWLTSAGSESLGWTDEQAQVWAAEKIGQAEQNPGGAR